MVLNLAKILFNLTLFIESLVPIEYRMELLEQKIDTNFFKNVAGKSFFGRNLCNQLRQLFVDFVILKAKVNQNGCPISVS